jgi:hypothetical protein
MTEQEKINESIAQGEQDAITLDFAKWSFQQLRANLPNDHNLWQIERDRTFRRQQSENSELRRKHLAKLDEEKAERQRERDAEIDLELLPQKETLMRDWLANNPYLTAQDFESRAWVHLRENLLKQRENDSVNAELQRLAGRYSF